MRAAADGAGGCELHTGLADTTGPADFLSPVRACARGCRVVPIFSTRTDAARLSAGGGAARLSNGQLSQAFAFPPWRGRSNRCGIAKQPMPCVNTRGLCRRRAECTIARWTERCRVRSRFLCRRSLAQWPGKPEVRAVSAPVRCSRPRNYSASIIKSDAVGLPKHHPPTPGQGISWARGKGQELIHPLVFL